MTHLNLYSISGILIIATYGPLAILVATKGRTLISRYFLYHSICVVAWGAGAVLLGLSNNQNLTINIFRYIYPAVLFIPVFFFHAVYTLTNQKHQAFLYVIYFQAILFSIYTLNTNTAIQLSPRLIWGTIYYIKGDTVTLISFIAWILIILFAHIKLIYHYRKNRHPSERKQADILALATPIGFLGGISNFLPMFGLQLDPYGNFLIPIYSLIVTHAILKEQFLNIEIIIKRSIVYSILVTLLSVIYLVLIILIERTFQTMVGYTSTSTTIAIAFILSMILIPLKNKIKKITDKNFFKRSTEEILKENELLKQEVIQAERLKTIATLASGMAHEIKNPLTPIKTFLEYLPQKSNDKEFIEKFGKLAYTSVERIDELINELLRFAKPSPLNLVNTDINKLINLNLEILSNEFIKHNIKVQKKISDHKILLNADQNQIRQAILNILLNAIDTMPNGGILTVTTTETDNLYQVAIQDSGLGISKHDLPYIFDPFFSKKDKGTGLGLSITHGIITEHGGTILVESKPGEGATFMITLPITKNS